MLDLTMRHGASKERTAATAKLVRNRLMQLRALLQHFTKPNGHALPEHVFVEGSFGEPGQVQETKCFLNLPAVV